MGGRALFKTAVLPKFTDSLNVTPVKIPGDFFLSVKIDTLSLKRTWASEGPSRVEPPGEGGPSGTCATCCHETSPRTARRPQEARLTSWGRRGKSGSRPRVWGVDVGTGPEAAPRAQERVTGGAEQLGGRTPETQRGPDRPELTAHRTEPGPADPKRENFRRRKPEESLRGFRFGKCFFKRT